VAGAPCGAAASRAKRGAVAARGSNPPIPTGRSAAALYRPPGSLWRSFRRRRSCSGARFCQRSRPSPQESQDRQRRRTGRSRVGLGNEDDLEEVLQLEAVRSELFVDLLLIELYHRNRLERQARLEKRLAKLGLGLEDDRTIERIRGSAARQLGFDEGQRASTIHVDPDFEDPLLGNAIETSELHEGGIAHAPCRQILEDLDQGRAPSSDLALQEARQTVSEPRGERDIEEDGWWRVTDGKHRHDEIQRAARRCLNRERALAAGGHDDCVGDRRKESRADDRLGGSEGSHARCRGVFCRHLELVARGPHRATFSARNPSAAKTHLEGLEVLCPGGGRDAHENSGDRDCDSTCLPHAPLARHGPLPPDRGGRIQRPGEAEPNLIRG
jgi:hypothetical protein